jgi:hypothetical protein
MTSSVANSPTRKPRIAVTAVLGVATVGVAVAVAATEGDTQVLLAQSGAYTMGGKSKHTFSLVFWFWVA